MSYEQGDEVICMRSKMKLCADPECYHSEPHECLKGEDNGNLCTVNQWCKARLVFTRCVRP